MPKSFANVRQMPCLRRRANPTHLAVLDGFANRGDDTVQRQLLARTNATGVLERELGTMGMDHTHFRVQVWLNAWLVSLVSVEDDSVEMVN